MKQATTLTPLEWIDFLHGSAKPGKAFIEFRIITGNKVVDRHFMPYPTFADHPDTFHLTPARQRKNTYFGVAPRTNDQSGTKKDCDKTHLIWSDVDLKDHGIPNPLELTEEELLDAARDLHNRILEQLDELDITSRAIVYSGHGLQVFAALEARTASIEITERYCKALGHHLGGDTKTFDVSRVLRVPGSINNKNRERPIPVEIWTANQDAVLTLDQANQILQLPEPETPKQVTKPAARVATSDAPADPWKIYEVMMRSADLNHRNNTGLEIACQLRDNRIPLGEAEQIMRTYATEVGAAGDHPYTETEAIASLRQAYAREPREPWAPPTKPARAKLAPDTSTPSANPAPEDTLLQRLTDRISELPHQTDQALELLIGTPFFHEIGQLTKPEQGLILQRLKRHAGIALTDARTYVRDATSTDLSPVEMRDIILHHWRHNDTHIRYIAEWQEWFTYEAGVYQKTFEETMLRRALDVLETKNVTPTEHTLKDVLAKLSRAEGIYLEYAPKPKPVLNLRNGLLDLDTLELSAHTPEEITFAQAPTEYDQGAGAPGFAKFLERVAPDQAHRLTLQEFAGYALTPYTFLQKSLYLKGPGGTGKGTLLGILERLLSTGPYGLMASMDIDELNDNSPSLVNAINKRLLYISEVPARANLLGFKKIVGEDRVMVNPKYKRPFDIRLEAKIIITANTHIHVGDDSSNNSIDRRLIILPFEQQPRPEDYNPNIVNDLSTPAELAGVLRWALAGWHRLRKQGYRFTTTGDEQQRLQFLETSNPVITFLQEKATPLPEAETGSTKLYEAWKAWCVGEEVNILAGQYDLYGKERERWRRTGGTGHHPGSHRTFTAKAEEAIRILGWEVTRDHTWKGRKWFGLELQK